MATRIKELSTQFPVIVLTGARQTGKTTLLRSLFSAYNYVSLDLPSEAENAENNPESFLSSHTPPVVIDEVQYAPKLFRNLKIIVDQRREEKGLFILTGSQKFNLMKEVSDSLAGRCVWLELEGLSALEISPMLGEFNTFKSQLNLICRGSFPELWKNTTISHGDFYRSYMATYIERDVRQIVNITSIRDFEKFIRLCAIRSGQLLNKSELSKEMGVSVKTITSWLNVLEASNQIVMLEPYFENVGKRLIKTPKLYFCDTGLLCFLLGIDENNLDNTPFVGNIWETFIFSEIRKNIHSSGLNKNIYFYRDQVGREVDFIIHSGNEIVQIESKWGEIVEKKDSLNMDETRKTMESKKGFPLRTLKQLIACRTPVNYSLTPHTEAVNGFNIGHQ